MVRKVLLWFVLLMVLGVNINAEVFTKKYSTIKYNLHLDKALNVRSEFTFKDLGNLRDNQYGPMFEIYSVKEVEGDWHGRHQYIHHIFRENNIILNTPLKKGDYLIKLMANGYYNKPFDFKLTKVSGHYEEEFNNNFKSATLMQNKKFYTGFLQTNEMQDEDFYKITMQKNAELDLVFKVNQGCQKETRGYENITLYKLNKDKPQEPTRLISMANVNHDFRKSIGLKKGDYFVQIRSNFKCIYDKEYNIAYLESPSYHIELEPNGTEALATPIKIDSYYYSAKINNGYDEYMDYFTFDVDTDKEIVFAIKQPNFTKGKRVDWFIKMYRKVNGKEEYVTQVGDLTYKKTEENKVAQARVTLKKGKYYISVRARDFSSGMGNTHSGSKYVEYGIALMEGN